MMNKSIIDKMVIAAEYVNKVIEAGRLGDFGGSNCRFWYDGSIMSHLDCLNALEGLKNEYECNKIEAAGAANPESAELALKSYYRAQIKKCSNLCPYEDCGIFASKGAEPTPWPVSPEWLNNAFNNEMQQQSKCALAWPIMRALNKCTIDASTASELLVKAYQAQSEFVGFVASLVQWWQDVEQSYKPKLLSQYPKANTKKAQKYFGKAIDKGFMEETATGYKWLIPRQEARGNKAALAYFLSKIYYPIPESELDVLFGTKRIGQASRASRTPLTDEIDKLFE